MQVSPLTPTTHTPPDGGSRSPGKQLGKRGAFLLSLKTQQIRALCNKYDRLAPRLLEGHAGRLEHALTSALETLRGEDERLDKWDRARGVCRRDTVDSAELRSIEDGGNG